MDIVHLTSPTGRPVSIVQSQIVQLREAGPDVDSRTKTVVVLSSGFQAVRETISQVEALLK